MTVENWDRNNDFNAENRSILDGFRYSTNPASSLIEIGEFMDINYEVMTYPERAELFYAIGRYNFILNNLSDCIDAVTKALSILELSSNYEGKSLLKINELKARLYNLKAFARSKTFQIFSFGKDLIKAFEYSIFSDDPLIEKFILNNIGDLYMRIDAYEDAIAMFKETLKDTDGEEKIAGDGVLIEFITNLNISICSAKIGNFEESGIYLLKAEKLSDKIVNPLLSIRLEAAKFLISKKEGRIDEALTIGERIFEKVSDAGEGRLISEELLEYLALVMELEREDLGRIDQMLKKLEPLVAASNNDNLKNENTILQMNLALRASNFDELSARLNSYYDFTNELFERYGRETRLAVTEVYEEFQSQLREETLTQDKLISEYAKLSVQRKKETFKREHDALKLINRVAKASRSSLELDSNLLNVLSAIEEQVPVSRVEIFVCDNEWVDEHNKFVLEKGKKVVEHSKIDDFNLSEELKNFAEKRERGGFSESFIFPMTIDKKPIGMIAYIYENERNFKVEEENLLENITLFLSLSVYAHKKDRILMTGSEIQACMYKDLEGVNIKLKAVADVDGLTEVANRRVFDGKYPFLCRQAINSGRGIAVFLIDIDDFKDYNEALGHVAGDAALKRIAKAMDAEVRGEKAVFARYGGEEFIAVSICDHFAEIEELSRNLLSSVSELKIEAPHSKNGTLSVSIGVSYCRLREISEMDRLIADADKLLNIAKRSGKNCFKIGEYDDTKSK